MSLRLRGIEVTVRVLVEGVLRQGLFRHLTQFTRNNREDIPETELLGQQETELDFIHSGFDLSWSCQIEDADNLAFVDELIAIQRDKQPLPPITIQVEYRFRDPRILPRMAIYRGVVMKEDSESFSSRTDYIECQYSAKAKRRTVMQLTA
jgi:hypothetical protein